MMSRRRLVYRFAEWRQKHNLGDPLGFKRHAELLAGREITWLGTGMQGATSPTGALTIVDDFDIATWTPLMLIADTGETRVVALTERDLRWLVYDVAPVALRGLEQDRLWDGNTPLCKADPASVCSCDGNDLSGRCPRR